MPAKIKYPVDLKVKVCEEYLSGRKSMKEICDKYGVFYDQKRHSCSAYEWIPVYKKHGVYGFLPRTQSPVYTKEFKQMVVKEYLKGKGSLVELTAKYKIRSKETLRNWILMYNSDMELKDYCPKGEVYMARAKRKTTYEERIEIVKECIAQKKDYKGTAEKYDVSYKQVYSWVKKYLANGEEGLLDKRGHHKPEEELDEIERLRRENARLKRELEEKDMVAELLKKVQEFERRGY